MNTTSSFNISRTIEVYIIRLLDSISFFCVVGMAKNYFILFICSVRSVVSSHWRLVPAKLIK